MASNAAESSSSKLEFDVNMTCNSCASKVQQSLETIGVKKFDIDVQNQSVVVDTDIPFAKVLGAIQATGMKAVLKGYGSPQGTSSKPSAVAEIFSTSGIMGVVRFSQISDRECVIDGTIDGLSDGVHTVEIHELGDLSNGCESTGDVYEPRTGVVGNSQKYGCLGEVEPDSTGRSVFRKTNELVKVSDIIGRSLLICSAKSPTASKGCDINSRLACGIIARASGISQNPKRICACDGVSIWDEANAPTK
uniref:Superoxide dismutase copper chaperone n=1 Tax=Ornithodoros turicata TaxID=34597 RepID=A0A2R5LIR2_9ACAR